MPARRVTRLTAKLAGFGVSAALAAGGITLASGAPAHAADVTTIYNCTELGGLVPAGTLQLVTALPDSVTTGGDLPLPVTGQLSGLAALGAGLDQVVGTVDTVLDVAGAPLPLSLAPVSLTDGTLMLNGAVDTIAGAAGTVTSVGAPQSIVLDGLVSGLTGVTCTLADDALSVLGTIPVLPLPVGSGDPAPITPAPSGHTTTSAPAPHHPAAKHRSVLRVHPTKKHVRQSVRARLRITVRAAGRPAAGAVVVRVGHRIVGHAMLRHGHIVLRLKKLSHGVKRVVVTYSGNATTTPARKRLKLHITR